MLEIVVLVVLAVNAACMAAWLTIGALENLLLPDLNETITSEVMDMQGMREDRPEIYALVSARRLGSGRVRRVIFWVIVSWELIAVGALWIGTGALVLAALGVLNAETALALALLGAMCFTATWAGFLVAGNWFCYWIGYEGIQNTHFHMTGWGLLNMILLVCSAGVLLR